MDLCLTVSNILCSIENGERLAEMYRTVESRGQSFVTGDLGWSSSYRKRSEWEVVCGEVVVTYSKPNSGYFSCKVRINVFKVINYCRFSDQAHSVY